MAGDISDQASDTEQLDRDLCIRAARQRAEKLEFKPKGRCYNCNARLSHGMRHCDADCRDDHMARVNAEIRKGRGQ